MEEVVEEVKEWKMCVSYWGGGVLAPAVKDNCLLHCGDEDVPAPIYTSVYPTSIYPNTI